MGRLLALTGPSLVLLFSSACDAQVRRAAEAGEPRHGRSASFEEIVAQTQSLVVRLELKHCLRLRKSSPLSSYLSRRIDASSDSWVLAEYVDPVSGQHAFVFVGQEKGQDRFLVATNYRPQKLDPDGNEVDVGEWDWDDSLVYEYDTNPNRELNEVAEYLREKRTLIKSWGNPEVRDGHSWLLSDGGGSRVYFYGYDVPWPEEERRRRITDDRPPPGEPRRQFAMIVKLFELWDDVRKDRPDRVIEIKKTDSQSSR